MQNDPVNFVSLISRKVVKGNNPEPPYHWNPEFATVAFGCHCPTFLYSYSREYGWKWFRGSEEVATWERGRRGSLRQSGQRVEGIVLAARSSGRRLRGRGQRAGWGGRRRTARAGRTRAPRFTSDPRSNDRRPRPVSYYRSINIPRARSPISKRSRGVFWTSDWQCRVKKTLPIAPIAPDVSIPFLIRGARIEPRTFCYRIAVLK